MGGQLKLENTFTPTPNFAINFDGAGNQAIRRAIGRGGDGGFRLVPIPFPPSGYMVISKGEV